MIKNEKIFLKHILENILDIKDFSKGISKREFEKNKLKQKAIIRSIEVIGEAVKNLSIGFTNEYPQIEWNKIAGMRDKLIHNYFGVDLDKVWEVIKRDLPILEKEIKNILLELENKK